MSSYIEVQRDKNSSKVRFNLPIITNLEDTYQVTLSEQSTYIYGYKNRFVMDMGTKRSFTVTCERPNPVNYNDSSSNPDDWSNGKWYARLIELLDPWQNLMQPNGGFTFHFESLDSQVMINIDKNVFLNGSISPSFGVQVLKFSLPLVVARVTGADAKIPSVSITFYPNTSKVSGKSVQSFPTGIVSVVPACPGQWTKDNKDQMFAYWSTSASDSGTRYYPGDMISWSTPITLYAIWKTSIQDEILSGSGTYSFTVNSSANRCVAYVVGAGGGGGGAGIIGAIQENKAYQFGGGGGAGGEFIIKSFAVRGGTMELNVGAGGEGGTMGDGRGEDGTDGGDSFILYGKKKIIARGGEGGSGRKSGSVNPAPALGGQKYYKGGDSGEAGTTGNMDGLRGVPGSAGPSGSSELSSGVTLYYSGGAGGGCPPLNHVANKNGTTYRSRGGDGEGMGTPGSGVYGGGGGTTAFLENPKGKFGGDGGDGIIFVRFYT